MKIRQGFVSNSSSSSFVAIAFNMKDHEKEYEKIEKKYLWKLDFYLFETLEDGVPEGNKYVGQFLANQMEDYENENIQFTLKDLNKKANEIKKNLALPEDLEWEIIAGTRCS